MSRLSSRRVASESRMERSELVDSAMEEERDRSAFIGASSTGLPASVPARKELTQRTSRKRRITCAKASRMPTTSTPTIRPFRPGLALKAWETWR